MAAFSFCMTSGSDSQPGLLKLHRPARNNGKTGLIGSFAYERELKQIRGPPTSGGNFPSNTSRLRLRCGLPHIRVTAKSIIYRRKDLDGWLERHRVAITR